MQKVVGSSPIIRFHEAPETGLLSRRLLCVFVHELRMTFGSTKPRCGYRRRLMHRVVLALLVATFAGAAAAARASAAPPACATPEVRAHNEAVFGHFSTLAAAKGLKARAAKSGFQGIKIENEGCGDFEVEIDGADNQADRSSFAREASKAGFPVTFEQTAPPMQYQQGQVVGVFGQFTTVSSANALMMRLSRSGFLFIDLARVGNRWLVVLPQVPVKHALSIAHEAAGAGFHIQFRPGTK